MGAIRGTASKQLGRIVLVVLLGALSPSVQAIVAVTNLTDGGSINFSNVVAPSTLHVLVGDKLFGKFGFQYISTSGNTNSYLTASDLVLSGLNNGVGYGLSFQLAGFSAQNLDSNDIKLSFSVQVNNPFNLISGVDLTINGGATGMGEASVSENIYTNGFGVGSIANLFATINASTATNLEDFVTFSTPQSMIWIEKDLSVSGDPGGIACGNPASNYAFLSIVDQSFAQIPEPSTMALLGAAMAGLVILRRRK